MRLGMPLAFIGFRTNGPSDYREDPVEIPTPVPAYDNTQQWAEGRVYLTLMYSDDLFGIFKLLLPKTSL
jgi:hypothetical protein